MRSTIASNERTVAVGLGLAEHHVIRAAFAGEHRIVAAVQAAAAGDARGLEAVDRGHERLDPGQVRAVGAGAGRDLGLAVEHQRGVLLLHDGRQRS